MDDIDDVIKGTADPGWIYRVSLPLCVCAHTYNNDVKGPVNVVYMDISAQIIRQFLVTRELC